MIRHPSNKLTSSAKRRRNDRCTAVVRRSPGNGYPAPPVHSRASIARAQPHQGDHPEAIVETGYGRKQEKQEVYGLSPPSPPTLTALATAAIVIDAAGP